MPTYDLKKIKIGPSPHQVTKIGISLYEEEERNLVDQLINNVNLIAWPPFAMHGIDTKMVVQRK